MPPADLVAVLTYYAPYVSGLTATAREVAEGLAARGRRVVVVTARHDSRLPAREMLNGVEVLRCRSVARVSKGLLCPTLIPTAVRELQGARLGHLHVPMLEAGPIAAAVAGRTPILTTYYCDVAMAPSIVNRAASALVFASARAALNRSAHVSVLNYDYARSSRLWETIAARPNSEVPPPCRDRSGGSPRYRMGTGPHVGFLGRIVEEKGLALLIDAFLKLDLGPDARLLIGGDFEGVAGGSVIAQLRAHAPDDDRVRFLGFIPEERLADFYASLDCFAFPSVNSFEAFGIVQVEAMSAGVPVVASNRPGVRVPVTRTGFGQVVAENDVGALAEGIAIELQHPRDRRAGRTAIEQFGVHSIVSAYDDLLSRLGRPK